MSKGVLIAIQVNFLVPPLPPVGGVLPNNPFLFSVIDRRLRVVVIVVPGRRWGVLALRVRLGSDVDGTLNRKLVARQSHCDVSGVASSYESTA